MSRYSNTVFDQPERLDVDNKRRVYDSLFDPTIPPNELDVYVRTVFGDRLDSLAFEYYSDSTLWWIIAAANPGLRKDSLFLDPNLQLRIPANPDEIIQLLQVTNQSR